MNYYFPHCLFSYILYFPSFSHRFWRTAPATSYILTFNYFHKFTHIFTAVAWTGSSFILFSFLCHLKLCIVWLTFTTFLNSFNYPKVIVFSSARTCRLKIHRNNNFLRDSEKFPRLNFSGEYKMGEKKKTFELKTLKKKRNKIYLFQPSK